MTELEQLVHDVCERNKNNGINYVGPATNTDFTLIIKRHAIYDHVISITTCGLPECGYSELIINTYDYISTQEDTAATELVRLFCDTLSEAVDAEINPSEWLMANHSHILIQNEKLAVGYVDGETITYNQFTLSTAYDVEYK